MKKLFFIFSVTILSAISMAMIPVHATKVAKPLSFDNNLYEIVPHSTFDSKCFKCPNGASRDGRAGNWSWSICFVNGIFHHVDVCYDFWTTTECINVSIVIVGGQVISVEAVGPTNSEQAAIINMINNNNDNILNELSVFISLIK